MTVPARSGDGTLLTAVEAATVLYVHVNTVKRLAIGGDLPFYRVGKRGDFRFRLDDLRDYLEGRRNGAAK